MFRFREKSTTPEYLRVSASFVVKGIDRLNLLKMDEALAPCKWLVQGSQK